MYDLSQKVYDLSRLSAYLSDFGVFIVGEGGNVHVDWEGCGVYNKAMV